MLNESTEIIFFPLCCQIEAECQEGGLGVCIWLGVCESGVGYTEGAVLMHLLSKFFLCVCVCACALLCECVLSRELSKLE